MRMRADTIRRAEAAEAMQRLNTAALAACMGGGSQDAGRKYESEMNRLHATATRYQP